MITFFKTLLSLHPSGCTLQLNPFLTYKNCGVTPKWKSLDQPSAVATGIIVVALLPLKNELLFGWFFVFFEAFICYIYSICLQAFRYLHFYQFALTNIESTFCLRNLVAFNFQILEISAVTNAL